MHIVHFYSFRLTRRGLTYIRICFVRYSFPWKLGYLNRKHNCLDCSDTLPEALVFNVHTRAARTFQAFTRTCNHQQFNTQSLVHKDTLKFQQEHACLQNNHQIALIQTCMNLFHSAFSSARAGVHLRYWAHVNDNALEPCRVPGINGLAEALSC